MQTIRRDYAKMLHLGCPKCKSTYLGERNTNNSVACVCEACGHTEPKYHRTTAELPPTSYITSVIVNLATLPPENHDSPSPQHLYAIFFDDNQQIASSPRPLTIAGAFVDLANELDPETWTAFQISLKESYEDNKQAVPVLRKFYVVVTTTAIRSVSTPTVVVMQLNPLTTARPAGYRAYVVTASTTYQAEKLAKQRFSNNEPDDNHAWK